MMSLWDALRMNMMISYQELVRTFPKPEACSYPFECLVSVCPFGLTRNIQIDNKKV